MKTVVFFVLACVLASPLSLAKLHLDAEQNSARVHIEKTAANKVRSSKQAAKMVKQRYGGKVLSVKGMKDKSGYRVKLLKKDGHIISVYVNAKTGKMQG